jgi:hypothetical protein
VSGIFSLYRSHNNNPFHAIVHKVIMMQMYIKCNKRDFLQDTLINIPPENGHNRYSIISEVFVPCNKGRQPCLVCPSTYDFRLHLWYLKPVLHPKGLSSSIFLPTWLFFVKLFPAYIWLRYF